MAPTHNPGSSTTLGLAVDPSLDPTLAATHIRKHDVLLDQQTLRISAIACCIGLAATVIAQILTALIGLITHLAFYGDFGTNLVSPAGSQRGLWIVALPALGGIIVGLMARYGSSAIRGHGIPEAMEQILFHESKIPARIMFLKPISAAISIGTGGPFGAEGPIIATGGALGSVIGQVIRITASERKTLLAAGAAAGMTAIFGSPLSALLLSIELLLFEFKPRSFIPVAMAVVTAMTVRSAWLGGAPVFPMPDIGQPSALAIIAYLGLGIVLGAASVWITKLVYWIEDSFEKLPIHWMWWPTLGGLVVGAVGLFFPRTLGVGYDNIEQILSGELAGQTLFLLCAAKLVSWSISLGSGTSGGTLAPLFTLGGGIGALSGTLLAHFFPQAGIDPRVAALVGMAAIFTGASRAIFASLVFAFETTRQPLTLLPLIAGCTSSFVMSALMMKHTIMTEKIARRGRVVPSEYGTDLLEVAKVAEYSNAQVVSFLASDRLDGIRTLLGSGAPEYRHQYFPVLLQDGKLAGTLHRNDILDPARADTYSLGDLLQAKPASLPKIHQSASLKQALNLMLVHEVGRLVVVSDTDSGRMTGILSRSDLFSVYQRMRRETHHAERSFSGLRKIG